MSDKYKMHEQEKAYFLTLTVVGWIDVFTRKNHKFVIVNSLKYCQKHKGLEIYAWCLMPSHLHLIVRSTATLNLPLARIFKPIYRLSPDKQNQIARNKVEHFSATFFISRY